MFFFGIFGIQDKEKNLKEFSNIICSCGMYSRMQLVERYYYFHFFFIPLFKWGREYYIEARCCGRVFKVPRNYIKEILESDTVDLNRLIEVNTPYRKCPHCGEYVDSNYKYCPHCGRKF